MNQAPRKLPIGMQSFERLREDGYLYVDKTEYIYELVKGGRQYFLSRPRRFGKSLFLSTLRAFWEGKKELFAGLAIERLLQDDPEAFSPHPVFYFDFTGKNYSSENALEEVLEDHLRVWETKYGGDGSRPLEERFKNLLEGAAEGGRGCVVLVDEYDKPLLDAMNDEALENQNRALFKGFFSVLKRCDEYLRFSFFTGVTKFSKVSIFSDLNQLKDISMNIRYDAICGITGEELTDIFMPEIEHMAEGQSLTADACLERLKSVYDGYRFHMKGERVYNPFSLLNALDDGEFKYYWFATGTPTFLTGRIRQSDFDLRKFTDHTLYADEMTLLDCRSDNPNPLPLLYQMGYLTIVDYDARRRRLTLGFPNEEVTRGFLESLMAG